jgi:probable HAF family extracellular repeat protein
LYGLVSRQKAHTQATTNIILMQMIQGLSSKRFVALVAGMVSLSQFASGAAQPGQTGTDNKPAYKAIDLGAALEDPDFQSSKMLSSSGKVALTCSLGEAGGWQYHAFSYSQGKTTDLGALGVASSSAAINASGQIAGYSGTADETSNHAVLFSKGKVLDLGTLPGGTYSISTGINNNGEVIGQSTLNNDSANHGFIYSHGKMIDLGSFDGDYSFPRDLNNSGQVVGEAYIDDGFHDGGLWTRAFLYSGGKMKDLGTLQNVEGNSWATRINEAGQVIGVSSAPEGLYRGFLYASGTMQDLGSFGGESYPVAINNKGQIAGVAYTTEEAHVFLWENGKMADLGIPGDEAFNLSLNEAGEIVGGSNEYSFLYSHGQAYQLGSLIVEPGTFSYLFSPVSINNSGEILVFGATAEGEEHAYLLVPVAANKGK